MRWGSLSRRRVFLDMVEGIIQAKEEAERERERAGMPR